LPSIHKSAFQYVGITDEKNEEVQKKGCFLWDDIRKVNENPPHSSKIIGTHTQTHICMHVPMNMK